MRATKAEGFRDEGDSGDDKNSCTQSNHPAAAAAAMIFDAWHQKKMGGGCPHQGRRGWWCHSVHY